MNGFRSPLLCALLLATGLACASAPAPDPAPAAPDTAAQDTTAPDSAAPDSTATVAVEPGDGTGEPGGDAPVPDPERPGEAGGEADLEPAGEEYEWLVDEEGNEYRTLRYDKVEGRYRWVDEDTILGWRGLRFDVAVEHEDHFLVKIYRTPDPPPRRDRPNRSFGQSPQAVTDLLQPADLEGTDRYDFVSIGQGLPDRGQWRNGLVITDFDGDGRLDVVHGPARKGRPVPWIFRYDGSESWSAQALVPLPQGLRLDYGDVGVGDFNRDGLPDLVLGVHLRGVVILVSDGQGGFERWSDGIPYTRLEGPGAEGPGQFTSRAVEVVDWNADGWPDVAALGEGGRMAISREDTRYRAGSTDLVLFVNQGDGSWEIIDLAGSGRLRGDSLAQGDFEGDGRPDLASGWMSSALPEPVVRNRTEAGGPAVSEVQPLPGLEMGMLLPAVTTGDFDGDGRDDLAVSWVRGGGDRAHGIFLYLSREDGWERRDTLHLEGRRRITGLGVGRLPGDPHLDLVAFDEAGNGWVFLGDGRGGLEPETAPTLVSAEPYCAGYSVTLADLDGEPGDEIVVGFAGEPGGEVLISGQRRCPGEGGIAAWKAQEKK